jgi:hypothetical protein
MNSIFSTPTNNGQADFFDPALANTGNVINPFSAPYNGVVDIQGSIRLASPVPGTDTTNTTGPGNDPANPVASRAGFGLDVLSADHSTYIAQVFIKPDQTPANNDDLLVGGPGNALINPNALPAQFATSDNTWGTYSMRLDFNAGQQNYVVTANGTQYGPFPLNLTAGTDIGGISLATDGSGNNTAFFDNFSVVPEPAMAGMIAVGVMLLLAKRPSRA